MDPPLGNPGSSTGYASSLCKASGSKTSCLLPAMTQKPITCGSRQKKSSFYRCLCLQPLGDTDDFPSVHYIQSTLSSTSGLLTGSPRPHRTRSPRPNLTGSPRPNLTGSPRPSLTGSPRPNLTGSPRPNLTRSPRPNLTGSPRPNLTGSPRPNLTGSPGTKSLNGSVNTDTKSMTSN